jgi:hypothetical protein
MDASAEAEDPETRNRIVGLWFGMLRLTKGRSFQIALAGAGIAAGTLITLGATDAYNTAFHSGDDKAGIQMDVTFNEIPQAPPPVAELTTGPGVAPPPQVPSAPEQGQLESRKHPDPAVPETADPSPVEPGE